MELWTIEQMFNGLGKPTSEFELVIPDLKKFRDAYAHIKERVEGIEKPFNQPKAILKREKTNVANGAWTSIDGGKTWNSKPGTHTFNFNGKDGMLAIFGIVNDYLICNSSGNLLELKIDNSLLEKIKEVINDACV